MPIPEGGRYRMKDGVRLHFTKAGVVDEARNMQTGAMHSAAEFRGDRKRKKRTLLSR